VALIKIHGWFCCGTPRRSAQEWNLNLSAFSFVPSDLCCDLSFGVSAHLLSLAWILAVVCIAVNNDEKSHTSISSRKRPKESMHIVSSTWRLVMHIQLLYQLIQSSLSFRSTDWLLALSLFRKNGAALLFLASSLSALGHGGLFSTYARRRTAADGWWRCITRLPYNCTHRFSAQGKAAIRVSQASTSLLTTLPVFLSSVPVST